MIKIILTLLAKDIRPVIGKFLVSLYSLMKSNLNYPEDFYQTRTKTSIRYAKENDREKRERKKGRRRDIEREGEIREREREREREVIGIER